MVSFDFISFPELETERLILRRIQMGDVDDWLTIWQHPEVIRYLIDFQDATTTRNEVQEIIQWTDEIFAQKSGVRWAITLKRESTMIGSCGFHLYSSQNRRAEIEYELHHDFWRRGIMSETLRVILHFGFDAMGLHRIEANVTQGNQASAGLLRHLGFVLEGTWRDKAFSRGRYFDLWQFGLLKQEFQDKTVD